jgi:hypothetical protein
MSRAGFLVLLLARMLTRIASPAANDKQFGFGARRWATLPGLNAKLSGSRRAAVRAKVGRLRLISPHYAASLDHNRGLLPELEFQQRTPGIQAHQFTPALLPASHKMKRAAIRAQLVDRGIGSGAYFSPRLMEEPYFRDRCVVGPLRRAPRLRRE